MCSIFKWRNQWYGTSEIFFILEIKDSSKNGLLIVATCYTDAEKLIYNSAIKWQTITAIFIAL